MKLLTMFTVLMLMTSCARYRLHKGSYASQVGKSKDRNSRYKDQGKTDLGLRISTQIDDELSSRNFGMINFIFENVTEDWIRIEKVYFKFDHSEINENVRFVSGNQLNYFLSAVNEMNREKAMVAAQNRAAWAAVATGVAAASSSSKNNYSGVNIITGAAFGAALSMNISQFENSNKKDNEKLFPAGHLYHKDFVVPPGLYSKKWILLNTKKHKKIGRLRKALLTYVTSKGKKETVEVDLKGYSDWQNDIGSLPQLGSEETEKRRYN